MCDLKLQGFECKNSKHPCAFAHDIKELRARNRKFGYKTELCRQFQKSRRCEFGKQCHFLHDEFRLPSTTVAPGKNNRKSYWWIICEDEGVARLEMIDLLKHDKSVTTYPISWYFEQFGYPPPATAFLPQTAFPLHYPIAATSAHPLTFWKVVYKVINDFLQTISSQPRPRSPSPHVVAFPLLI